MNKKIIKCSYGENAWQQQATLTLTDSKDPLSMANFKLVEGAPLSGNNWCDIDRALQTITHIAEGFNLNFGQRDISICVGVKHGNPCGACIESEKANVLEKTISGDPVSIFGGLLMTNFEIDESIDSQLKQGMFDAIVSPKISINSIESLRRKNGRCRFVVNKNLRNLNNSLDHTVRQRYVRGGFISQPNYTFIPNLKKDVVLYGKTTMQQEEDMILAWAIGSTSNSNTITLVKNGKLLANAVGQQDRVGAAELAVKKAIKAGHDLSGAVAYSDSFFPFDDGPKVLIDAGINSIFTSSGSIRDEDTVRICKSSNVSLYMIPDKIGRGFFGH